MEEISHLIKNNIQHGNSSAVILDKPVMELIDIDADTLLVVSTDGTSIIISPVSSEDRLKRLGKSPVSINGRHAITLKKPAR